MKRAFLLLAGVFIIAPSAQAAEKFAVESSSYRDGETIPKKYAGAAANCGGGEEISPHVSWKNLPEGAKSVAVFLLDPDGQKGLGTSHLVAYNIAADRGELKEGEMARTAEGITVGPNVTGEAAYRGMCPQPTDHPHHYILTVVATSLEPGSLPADLDRRKLLDALEGHALVGQSIVGRYGQ